MSNGIDDGMTATISIDKAGRVVLPKAIRERLYLRAGTKLKAEVIADHIELTPESDKVRLVRKGKRLVIEGFGPLSDDQIVAAIHADREERIEHLSPQAKRR